MITFRPIGIFISVPDPDPTVNIPAYTIRIRLLNGGNPPSSQAGATVSQPFPSQFPNIYDYTLNSSDWNHILASVSDSFEIVGINSTGISNMNRMFDLSGGLQGSIPLFDTSTAYDVENMFYECHNVTGGMYALYNQMANQTYPPANHSGCFSGCGDNTVEGQAELSQIPSEWGGNEQPPVVENWEHKLVFYTTSSSLHVNTICMNREQEGNGSCYSDAACQSYMYDLSAWDSSTADTWIDWQEQGEQYFKHTVYVQNASIYSGVYGTIISAANESDYEWAYVEVYDRSNTLIGTAGPATSQGEWVNITYNS